MLPFAIVAATTLIIIGAGDRLGIVTQTENQATGMIVTGPSTVDASFETGNACKPNGISGGLPPQGSLHVATACAGLRRQLNPAHELTLHSLRLQ